MGIFLWQSLLPHRKLLDILKSRNYNPCQNKIKRIENVPISRRNKINTIAHNTNTTNYSRPTYCKSSTTISL